MASNPSERFVSPEPVPDTPSRSADMTESMSAFVAAEANTDLSAANLPAKPSAGDTNEEFKLDSRDSNPAPVTVLTTLTRESGFVKFNFAEDLGRGGMGVVKRATDKELRREVAIKMLRNATNPEAVQRFVEEAQITGQLEHPNIIPVHELGLSPDSRPFMAMKLVRGRTLKGLVGVWMSARPKKLRPSDINEIIDIVRKVCDAMAFAHEKGVIHRDLKVDNIMVGRHGEVLVMDWGLAKPLGHADPETRAQRKTSTRLISSSEREAAGGELTGVGNIVGTLAYMPPEQADPSAKVDERSDIFAIGGILYFLLTYERPYVGKNALDLLRQVVDHKLVSPRKRSPERGIPRELSAIVKKAMAKKPADRYPRVADLEADLVAFQNNLPTTAFRYKPWNRCLKWVRRHPSWALLTILVFVSALIVGYSSLRAAELKRDWLESQRQNKEQELQNANLRADQERMQREREKAEFQALAQQGQIDQLVANLGITLNARRDQMLADFMHAYDGARARGENGWSFLHDLGRAKIGRFVWAFEELLEARNAYGEQIAVRAEDYYYLGILYLVGLQHRERAIELFESAVKLRPDYASAYIGMGNAVTDAREQIQHFTAAIALDPKNAYAYRRRGEAYAADGKFDLAQSDFARSLDLRPKQPRTWLARGHAYELQGELDLAEAAYSAAMRADADLLPAYEARAHLRMQTGKFDGALADLSALIERAAQPADYLDQRARLLLDIKRPADAIADFSAIIALDPNSDWAYERRAWAKKKIGDHDGAIADLEIAARLSPDPRPMILLLAEAQIAANKPADALETYTRAIATDAKFTQAHHYRGRLHMQMGNLDAAIRDFTSAITFDPTSLAARKDRADARLQAGDVHGAIADFTEILVLKPDSVPILTRRSMARLKLNDITGAIKDSNRAVQLAPTSWEAWFAQGLAMHRANEPRNARDAFAQALGCCPADRRAELEAAIAAIQK